MVVNIHGPAITIVIGDREQLRNERQRGFVDLRGGLEQAHHQTDHQRDQQQRRGEQQADIHGLVRERHDGFLIHGESTGSVKG
jgi:hypothetical protein